MMALAKCISHTSESMGYGWNEKEKNATVISQKHMIANSPKEATEMFKLVQSTNSNCDKNTISVVLSRSNKANNHFTKKEWKQYIKDFIEEMNLEEHQHIGFRHFDKNHDHVHLYINRINFKGEAYKDSFIGSECGIAADRLNIKYGIERPKQIKKDREEKLKSDHRDIRASIYKHHCFVLDKIKPSSYSEYVSAFAKADIKVLAVTSKNGHLNGFRYEKNGISFKASQVHRSMSLVNLNKVLFPSMNNNELKKQNFRSYNGSYGAKGNQNDILEQLDSYTSSYSSPIVPSDQVQDFGPGDDEIIKKKRKKKKRRGRSM